MTELPRLARERAGPDRVFAGALRGGVPGAIAGGRSAARSQVLPRSLSSGWKGPCSGPSPALGSV